MSKNSGTTGDKNEEEGGSFKYTGEPQETDIDKLIDAYVEILANQKVYDEKIGRLAEAVKGSRKDLEESRKDLEESRKDLENRIDSNRIKIIEALGIFVALFTFISVNIQIFRHVPDLKIAAWFSILLAGLTLFILLIIYLIVDVYKESDNEEERKQKDSRFTILLVLAIILVALGIIVISIYNPRNIELDNKNNGQIEIENTLNQKIPDQINIKNNP